VICQGCGGIVPPASKFAGNPRVYCSRICGNRVRDRRRNSVKMTKRHRKRIRGRAVPVLYAQCIVCRALYVRHPNPAKNLLHCGRQPRLPRMSECHPDRKHDRKGLCAECYIVSLRKPIQVSECPECGDTFRLKNSLQVFCGANCSRPSRKRRDKARRRALLKAAFIEDVEDRLVFERDGWVCQLCYQSVPDGVPVPDPWAATIDHIIPIAKGGTHGYANVQLAHFECNWRKRDQVGWTWTEAEAREAA
jgi:hypothetical protein